MLRQKCIQQFGTTSLKVSENMLTLQYQNSDFVQITKYKIEQKITTCRNWV